MPATATFEAHNRIRATDVLGDEVLERGETVEIPYDTALEWEDRGWGEVIGAESAPDEGDEEPAEESTEDTEDEGEVPESTEDETGEEDSAPEEDESPEADEDLDHDMDRVDDDVTVVTGVGPARAEDLGEHGIETAGDLADLDGEDLPEDVDQDWVDAAVEYVEAEG